MNAWPLRSPSAERTPLIAALKAIFLKSVFFFLLFFSKEPFLSALQGTSERAVDLHDDSDDRLKCSEKKISQVRNLCLVKKSSSRFDFALSSSKILQRLIR